MSEREAESDAQDRTGIDPDLEQAQSGGAQDETLDPSQRAPSTPSSRTTLRFNLGPQSQSPLLTPNNLRAGSSGRGGAGGGSGGTNNAGNSNNLPAAPGTQKAKFKLANEIPDEDIEDSDVVIPKEQRGPVGSKHYNSNMDTATKALDNKFGVPKHKIVTPDGAEASSGNQTKSLRIQNTIMDLMLRLSEGHHRSKRMDFMDILLVPKLLNSSSPDARDWWDESETNLWTDWDSISERQAISWQWCVNKFFSEEDRISSRWLKIFLVNSSTPELRKEVDKKYDKLDKSKKGGVTYLFYMLGCLFTMTREVKKAIQDYLAFWKSKGLAKVQGENMAIAEHLLLGACKRLAAVGALHEEYVIDVLEGLCICSCPDFKDMFQVMLQMAKLNNFSVLDTITPNSTPMEMIEAILTKAVDLYNMLAEGGKWNIQNRGGGGGRIAMTAVPPRCWNCGKEGCNVKQCKQPKDRARIDANKAKWEAERKAARQKKGSNGGGTNSQQPAASGADYQRKKWESQGLVMVGDILMCKCKTCGPNFTHSSRKHDEWKAGRWTMPANHPLYVCNRELGKTVPTQVQPPPTAPPSQGSTNPGTASQSSGSPSINISKSALTAKIAAYERNSTDPNAVSVAEAIRQMLLN